MPDLKMSTETTESKRLLYSMKELADFLGCTTVTAGKLKASGRIPYVQFSRKLIFDTEKIMNALEQNPKSRK